MNLLIDRLDYRIHQLHFFYDAHVQSGITGVFGPSGTGKTTLLHLLCGILTPDSGRILFNGRVFFDPSRSINLPPGKRNLGVVFQNHYLFPHMTVRGNLHYSRLYRKPAQPFIAFGQVTSLLDLDPLLDKKPAQLSGGERQRVAIGRALLSQPDLLLMDEPFSNLDKKRREQIIAYLLKINDRFHVPLLIISHDLEDMLKLTDFLLVIQNGKILAAGPYQEIAGDGRAGDLLTMDRYCNIFELRHLHYLEAKQTHLFGANGDARPLPLHVNPGKLVSLTPGHSRVRFALRPADITLNTQAIDHTSARNQWEGKIVKIRCGGEACFLTVDCGVPLVSQITRDAVDSMELKEGQSVYCLVKSNALDVIYIYN